MISIIIVGKNEGWRLTKCLQRVQELKLHNNSNPIETIYVDSKSTDDSLERALIFPDVRIFQITGVTNSAIARNIGAKEANGEILFFIDGDMEIQSEFLREAIGKDGGLKHDYLTGHLDDYYYTLKNEFIGKAARTYKTKIPDREQSLNMNGGLFMINKKIWDKVNGMRNKYKRSQDFDLTIRLKKKGYKIIRIPFLAAKHHTVHYDNENRMWLDLFNKHSFYYALLFREHLFNWDVIKRSIRSYYTAIALLLTFVVFVFFNIWVVLYSYLLILVVRALINTWRAKTSWPKSLYFLNRVLYQIVFDISFWIGFLFFYPINPKLEYIPILKPNSEQLEKMEL